MSNTRKYSEHIGPSKDSNWDGIEKAKNTWKLNQYTAKYQELRV